MWKRSFFCGTSWETNYVVSQGLTWRAAHITSSQPLVMIHLMSCSSVVVMLLNNKLCEMFAGKCRERKRNVVVDKADKESST